jgi:hydrogenase/urease accessory protein HupE
MKTSGHPKGEVRAVSLQRRVLHGVGLLAAAWAAPADAHLVDTGFGDFYDGIAHLAVTPADVLVLIACALLAAQQGPRAARWTVIVLPLAWVVAGAVGALSAGAAVSPVLTTLSFGVAGTLIVLQPRLPLAAVAGFVLLVGMVHGYANGATAMPGGASALALAGASVAVFCLLTIVAGQASTLRAGWSVIGVRVAGSWLAAVAILMLGWMARPVV